MTDEHGSESQPAHEEEAPAEEQPAQEGEANVWSDDHPPVDDFADSGSTAEEMATVSQETAPETEAEAETGTEAEAGDEETVPSETGRRRSMLPIFAGIGGILLLGAVVYWEFGRSAPQPSPAVMMAQSIGKPSPAVPANPKPSGLPAMPNSSAGNAAGPDIAALKSAPPSPAQPSAPMETTPTTAMAPIPQTAPSAPIPAMPPQAVLPQGSPPISGSTNIKAEQERIDSLTTRIDDLQKSLDQATRQLNQVSSMIAANQAMPPVSSQPNPAVEDRLNKIEQNVVQLEHDETAKAAPLAAPPPEMIETPRSVVKTVPSRTASSAKPKHRYVHKHVHKKPKPVHHEYESRPATSEIESVSSAWVLRAATPSEAWVSADATSPELRHVQVGDTLAGIGRVRAIRQIGGGWEVEGTSGTVR